MRPKNVNDLQILWAIRDIPADLITFEERSILNLLLSIIGNNEYCYYSLDELVEKFGASYSTFKRLLKSLTSKKFIQTIRPEKQGRGQNNHYILNYEVILNTAKGVYETPLLIQKEVYETPLNERRGSVQNEKGVCVTPAYKEKKDIKEIHKNKESKSISLFEKKNPYELTQTAKFWGPGHPDYDRSKNKHQN
jgi:hypothetical protein